MSDQIKVRIIADSVNLEGVRLTSFLVTYPRYIHAEIMTHRMISKNSASSRAIPTPKLLKVVETNPIMPVRWGANQKGMQSGDVLSEEKQQSAEMEWRRIAEQVAEGVACLNDPEDIGLHKQWANRPLEPFLPITVLMTATEWKNFFALRAHPAAMPDLQVLAYRMLSKYLEHEPQVVGWGDWHMPFGDKMEAGWTDAEKLAVATARCARLSYMTFDGEYSYEEDRRLHDQLWDSKHWACFEHCAQAIRDRTKVINEGGHLRVVPAVPTHGSLVDVLFERSNFHSSWRQYRKQFANEHGADGVDLGKILQDKPDWITL